MEIQNGQQALPAAIYWLNLQVEANSWTYDGSKVYAGAIYADIIPCLH